jgi:nitric oxide reductase subunit B
MLMVVLDLFPAGVLQFVAVLDHGFWFARSDAFLLSTQFQLLTWLRGIGTVLFILGGVLPIAWFMVSRARSLKSGAPTVEERLTGREWVMEPAGSVGG